MTTVTATMTNEGVHSRSTKKAPRFAPPSKARMHTDVPFTMNDLKNAIPAHCFERSNLTSFTYLTVNLAAVGAVLYLGTFISQAPPMLSMILWPAYWIVQGCLGTGLWILAHECGHRAFSASNLINDSVGLVLHSMLYVPYHSWRISHGRHHGHTNHMDLDEPFVPYRKDTFNFNSVFTKGPIGRLAGIVSILLFGWPLYLIANLGGRPYPGWANHFLPSSPVFSARQANLVILSDVALLTWTAILWKLSSMYSFATVVAFYGIPYLIVNFWLVLITYLQHTDEAVPHYEDSEWTWVRGALCTVDRDYGILNHVFHHIGDTHVAHHLFSQIPHYHAQEATEALKKKLGKYYRSDSTNIFVALWRTFNRCDYVVPDDAKAKDNGIVWYKKAR